MTERGPEPQRTSFAMADLAFSLGVAGVLLTSSWCAAVYLIGDRANAALLMPAALVDLLALVLGLAVIAVGSGRAPRVGLKRGVLALVPAVMLVFSPLLLFLAALVLRPAS